MKKLKTFQNDALGRQDLESILIRKLDDDEKINSKDEYLQPSNIIMKATKNGKILEEYKDPREDIKKEMLYQKILEENINSKMQKLKSKPTKRKLPEDQNNIKITQYFRREQQQNNTDNVEEEIGTSSEEWIKQARERRQIKMGMKRPKINEKSEKEQNNTNDQIKNTNDNVEENKTIMMKKNEPITEEPTGNNVPKMEHFKIRNNLRGKNDPKHQENLRKIKAKKDEIANRRKNNTKHDQQNNTANKTTIQQTDNTCATIQTPVKQNETVQTNKQYTPKRKREEENNTKRNNTKQYKKDKKTIQTNKTIQSQQHTKITKFFNKIQVQNKTNDNIKQEQNENSDNTTIQVNKPAKTIQNVLMTIQKQYK